LYLFFEAALKFDVSLAQKSRENLDALICFAAKNCWVGVDEFLWRRRLLVAAPDDIMSACVFAPCLILSLPVSADDDLQLTGLALTHPEILNKLSLRLAGEAGAILPIEAAANLGKKLKDPFVSSLVQAFSKLISITLRALYLHEVLDPTRNPLGEEELRFWSVTLNRLACLSLLRDGAGGLATAGAARVLWERRGRFGLAAEKNWLVADALPESNFDAEFIAQSLLGEDASFGGQADRGLANVLRHLPHAIAFHERVRIFQAIITTQHSRFESTGFRSHWAQAERQIRRSDLFADGFEVFRASSSQGLKDRVRIKFRRDDGSYEAGIDGGGLFKEFLHLWVKEVTSPERGYFFQVPGGQLCPRPLRRADEIYFALGKAVGKAMFEFILNETRFSDVFLARVVGQPWSVDELAALDPELHRNLLQLKDQPGCEQLGLTFSVAVEDDGGVLREVDLVENGRQLAVTDANKVMYIHKLAKFKVVSQIAPQARAFSQGVAEVVSLDALKLFAPSEIQLLMAGEERRGFDVSDLRKFTHLSSYGRLSTTVELFWKVVEEDFSPEDQSALLSFVTSSPRPPLLGFKVLSPQFTIQKVTDTHRLPTASTCVNLLKLPDYEDRKTIKEKLLLAIHSGAGFDFS